MDRYDVPVIAVIVLWLAGATYAAYHYFGLIGLFIPLVIVLSLVLIFYVIAVAELKSWWPF